LTTSCTAALELSAMLLRLQDGDTVVVPAFSFTTSALAFAREGARLVFCDIEPETLGLDPVHLASLMDDTVRAVVIVHYAGVACDLEGIGKVLEEWPAVALVEDNAHGLFGSWRNQPLGSFGRFAAQSFHDTKNFVCGEGGALLINDASDIDRARVLYDKGTNRSAFLLGQVDKYSWRDTGSSFGLSDALAAYLLAQLEQREVVQAKRAAVHANYERLLTPFAQELDFELPAKYTDRVSAYHMFYVLLPDIERRTAVIERMRDRGVVPAFHYVPLHTSVAGRTYADRPTECPVTEDVSDRLLRLPFYNDLTVGEVERVVETFVHAVRATAAVGRR
jgi:dTDP-4-amino-4,6-dideoxygalactose transaminase